MKEVEVQPVVLQESPGPSVENVDKYVRAAHYLTAIQIYLRDNFLLERKLESSDIKPRLLGHWGSCPGSNFIYAHLNRLILRHRADILFVLGPGHGFPSLQANLFLEGSLGEFYPEATRDSRGLAYLARNFSWPYGFPSHSHPGTPGVILEGGELGYALATAYGAALDNPGLIVACVIGDGEAETGPTAGAWHLNKIFDPAGNGAVLPILHLNGYKISGPTVFGRMSDRELTDLFRGYGYNPYIVQGPDSPEMAEALEASYAEIRSLQERARRGEHVVSPQFPMIILKTPKGWTGIDHLQGRKIEGNHLSHQVVVAEARTDREQLQALENWLRSYRFQELFDKDRGFDADVLSLVPPGSMRMGMNRHAFASGPSQGPLHLPDPAQFAEAAPQPGRGGSSSMRRAGLYLNEVFRLNRDARNFRLLSPDETYSNKLDAVFETTHRAWVWPREAWDDHMAADGRVMEMLSEHNLQGLMQGYVLTGRHAVFASYEAFIQVIVSMADQYAKFLHVARTVPWRKAVPSLNYILTSSGWRQEHNGFSHQNPGFIDDMLQRHGEFVKVYFPADGNSTLAALRLCLASENGINVLVAGKTLEPRWLDMESAERQVDAGVMIWDFASDPEPDVVVCGIGDYVTKEALAAIDLVRRATDRIRLRFVNVSQLTGAGIGGCTDPVSLQKYFTSEKPVIFNFHGYPQTLKQILFDFGSTERFTIHGYVEEGSTTTPFDMHVRNQTSRFHLAIDILRRAVASGLLPDSEGLAIADRYRAVLDRHQAFIREQGVDLEEVEAWQWGGLSS